MNVKKGWSILKATFSEFSKDNVLRLSAALAYYAIFSIGPLLIIVVGVAGIALGNEAARSKIHQQLQSMLGQNSAQTLDSMMASHKHGSGLVATIVGTVILLFGAAGVFGQLQDSLNTIWGVKAKPGAGVWKFIRSRVLSLAMVLGIGFLLLASVALSTFLSAMTGSLASWLPLSGTLATVLNLVLSLGIVTVLFAVIFKYLPDVKVPFRKVWVGALGTALLFTAGEYLLTLYLGRQSTASAYGAAGSVVVILLWIYYTSVILFFGAEFTQVYARQTGARIVPDKYAVPVTEPERAQQGSPRPSGTGEAALEPRRPKAEPALPHRQPVMYASGSPQPSLRDRPWSFLGLLLATGVAAGVFLRPKLLRRGLGLYTALRLFRARYSARG